MIYACCNKESVCSKRNLKIKTLPNCMKFWGIVLEHTSPLETWSICCRDEKFIYVSFMYLYSFAVNLALSLFPCNKTFCCLFLLQTTQPSPVKNPEILFKRTIVSTAPSSTVVQSLERRWCEHWNEDGLRALLHTARESISAVFSLSRRLTDPY